MHTRSRQEGQNLLNPNYIVGFVDGEGCFSVGCSQRKDVRLGFTFTAAFEIEMTVDDKDIVERIHQSLGRPGQVYTSVFKRYPRWKPHIKLKVSNIKDLTEKIIPFFKKYPPQSKKRKSFEIFCKIVEMIKQKKHLQLKYAKKIVEMRNKMNPTGKGYRKYYSVKLGSRSAGNPPTTPDRIKSGSDRYL